MGRSRPAPVTQAEEPRLGASASQWRLGGGASSSTASPSREAPAAEAEDQISAEEFDTWCAKLWIRLDRDQSGEITRDELNCDEFQIILKSVIAPSSDGQNRATYSRTELHIEQALNFCLRKADINNDGVLSYLEFKAFMRALRNQRHVRDRADLIYALFDVDSNGTIDREEFKGICRYYLGHEPTVPMLNEEWLKLDPDDKGFARKSDYMRWLKGSANPAFRQQCSIVEGETAAKPERRQVKPDSVEGLLEQKRRKDRRREERPLWNQGFNTLDVCAINEASPPMLRTYISRPQSLPELHRFLDRHGHSAKYDDVRKFLAQRPPPDRRRILSGDTAALPMLLPERHQTGGAMRNKRGQRVEWNDAWQAPKEVTHGGLGPRRVPGSLTLRCAGSAPAWLYQGKDYEEAEVPLS